jgi:Domain of unknown function (DUF4326)
MTTHPPRLTRSRKRGSRTPEGAIYVGRPTLWGNPFTIDRFGHARCVILHRYWLAGHLGALTLERMGFCPAEIDALDRKRDATLRRLPELTGRALVCWCPQSSRWCHADTLIQLANVQAKEAA